MPLKLFTYPQNYRAFKTLIAAQYNDVEIEVPEFKFPSELATPEFQSKTPVRKVPVLETPHGCLFESNSIARYVARLRPETNLTGCSFFESGLVDQWIDFCALELEPPRNVWIYPILGFMKYEKRAAAKAKSEVERVMNIINDHLQLRTYMVGQSVTLADIVLGCALIALYEKVFEKSQREKYANVTRWITTLINQNQWKEIIGTVTLCEKEQIPVQPKQQKQQKQKSSEKQQHKSETPAGGESNVAQKPQKKQKNVLDALPRSEMDLDTTKRTFSNFPFDEALKMFYESWDPEGFCLYISNYNYNSENVVDFQTSNLVSGWLQRLDSVRKYGFGCVNIWGKEDSSGPFTVSGAWVFRGASVPFEFSDCPDSEYHTLEKVDLNNPEQKANFEALLGGSQERDGVPIFERKYFK